MDDEEEEQEEEDPKNKKDKNKKGGKGGKMDKSKGGSPSKNIKQESYSMLDKKRNKKQEANIANYIEEDNKKRQKISELDDL